MQGRGLRARNIGASDLGPTGFNVLSAWDSRWGSCCAGLFGPLPEGACATTGSAAATAGSATATATAGSASPARLSLAWFGFVAWRFAGFRET